MSFEPSAGGADEWPTWFHGHGGYANHLGLFKSISSFFKSPYVTQGLTYSAISVGTRAFYALLRWSLDRIGFPWFVNGHFVQSDPAYEWVMHYLIEEGIWRRSTAYKVSARNTPKGWATPAGFILSRNKDENAEFMPTWEKPRLFRWNGYWVDIKGTENVDQMHGVYLRTTSIKITIYSFDINVLSQFVEHARQSYMRLKSSHVIVHLMDSNRFGPGSLWNHVKRKARRPLDTVILQEGVLEDLVADAQEFLASEDFYNAAGVPHRRGVLLWGPPGTGKTTTIYSIASELELEIYSLSLASNMVDDSILQQAASAIPKDGILLIEDIDCAFPSRDDDENQPPFGGAPFGFVLGRPRSAVTMSGLLNLLDGVGSDEGKLFFATTNYIDRLDPAILRPGRIDKQVEYHLASHQQAHDLFVRWFSVKRGSHIVLKADVNLFSGEELEKLAKAFAECLPPNEFSTAELQGFLLLHKHDPIGASQGLAEWVEHEREARRAKEERERIKKEKAASKKGLLGDRPPLGGLDEGPLPLL